MVNSCDQAVSSVGLKHLPEEVHLRILSYLGPRDLCRLRQVNGKFRRLADEPLLWHRLYRSRFLYSEPILPDANGILTLVNAAEYAFHNDDNVWRLSYQILNRGVHLFPDDNTSDGFNRVLRADPNALVLLHPGLHVLRRPLTITSSPRILGLGPGSAEAIRRRVRLEVQKNCANLTVASPACRAQLAFLTIGFKQIGHARAPLTVKAGARPSLTHCSFANSSQMGWALVVSDPDTAPVVRRCLVPDGAHKGLLLCQAGGRFEENEFGQCSDVCLKLVSSSATFATNWVRPGNKAELCEDRGSIGGEVLPGFSHVVAIETDEEVPETLAWRIEQGWGRWSGGTPADSPTGAD